MFEAFIMALSHEMPVSAVAGLMAEHDTRLWRIVRHYVARAHERQDWSAVQAVAVDDTATRKGRRYATVVVEIDPQQEPPARLLFMTLERTAGASRSHPSLTQLAFTKRVTLKVAQLTRKLSLHPWNLARLEVMLPPRCRGRSGGEIAHPN